MVIGMGIGEAAVRVALAFLLALPVGWERERRARLGGLRTYPLLSVCVCGFLLVGQGALHDAFEQADVFFGVVTGIGFVGAGAVTTSPSGARGVNAAVSLWVTGAIGVSVAWGSVPLAASICGLTLLSSRFPAHDEEKGKQP